MILSTWKQAEFMRREYPTFKVLHRTRWLVTLGRIATATESDLQSPSVVAT